MGNCLKSPTSDDISLLHESQSDRASYGDGTDLDQEPPPPYQVSLDRTSTKPASCKVNKRLLHSKILVRYYDYVEQYLMFTDLKSPFTAIKLILFALSLGPCSGQILNKRSFLLHL